MGALETDEETGEKITPPHKVGREGRCWRCLKNPSRIAGEDFSCEPCHLWMTGESDEDPREGFSPTTDAMAPRPPAVMGRWGFPTRLEP